MLQGDQRLLRALESAQRIALVVPGPGLLVIERERLIVCPGMALTVTPILAISGRFRRMCYGTEAVFFWTEVVRWMLAN